MTMIDPEARAVIVYSAAAETLGDPDQPPLCGSAQILAGTEVVTMQQGDLAVVPHMPHAFAATPTQVPTCSS